MNKSCKNIYKIARNSAQLTREVASELLNIAPRTLAYYESDKKDFTRPDGSVVDLMVTVYRAEWLAYMHSALSSETSKKLLPPINTVDLARGVLTLQSYIDTVQSQNSKLINIAMDGVVSKSEEKEWTEIIADISKLAGAAMSLVVNRYEESLPELELQKA